MERQQCDLLIRNATVWWWIRNVRPIRPAQSQSPVAELALLVPSRRY